MTYQEDILELVHVVDAFGEELGLDLVDDLVHAVSPVCHLLASLFPFKLWGKSVCSKKTLFFLFD